jgi:hypothetical protein
MPNHTPEATRPRRVPQLNVRQSAALGLTMINVLKTLTGVHGWKFYRQEGSTMALRELTDRRIEVDLNAFDRLKTSQTVSTQVFAYLSFSRLSPIHARMDETLPKPQRVYEPFHVHERKTFPMRFSINWKSELRELLSQIED